MFKLEQLIREVRARLENRVLIMHGNRLEASNLWNLYQIGAVPGIHYAFTSVAGRATAMVENLHTLEEDGVHGDLCWGYQPYWDEIDALCARFPNALLLPTFRKPLHEEIVQRHNTRILCPPVQIAAYTEDKGNLNSILTRAGVPEHLLIPEVLFDDAGDMPDDYWRMVDKLGGHQEFIIQILASAGGARHDLKSSISVVSHPGEYRQCVDFQAGHGPCKVAVFIHGMESNGAAVATPWGTYIDDPSHKVPGLPQLYGRPGSGSGNDWTWGWPKSQLRDYREIMKLVGAQMADMGFFGIFGVDNLNANRPHEINGRAQGTTEQQERSSLRDNLPPLTLLALAYDLGVPREMFPDPDEFSMANTGSSDGWYLKVNMPTDQVVEEDINGLWRLEDGLLVDHDATTSALEMGDSTLYIYGAPRAGNLARAQTALPTLYVNGWNGQIFDPYNQLTSFGLEVTNAVYDKLGLEIDD